MHYWRLMRTGDVGANTPHRAAPIADRFWGNVDVGDADACWEWRGYVNPDGYGRVRDDDGKLAGTHRVAYRLEHGSVPNSQTGDLRVLHHCDNPPCCNPAHLYLGTQKDNARDRSQRGRGGGSKIAGERNPSAKLTQAQVNEIRRRIDAGLGYGDRKRLCEEFGIGTSTFHRIQHGHNWR